MSEERPKRPSTATSRPPHGSTRIIQRLDPGDAQPAKPRTLRGSQGLIEYCAGELAAVDQGLKELKLEDLASSP